jgi:threonine dehydrogenase-like Zn-dependent dehydrogenase
MGDELIKGGAAITVLVFSCGCIGLCLLTLLAG